MGWSSKGSDSCCFSPKQYIIYIDMYIYIYIIVYPLYEILLKLFGFYAR